jgi:xylulokinase
VTLESQEGSAYGAALLAMVGTGAFSNLSEACAACIREVDAVEPRSSAVYQAGHQRYQALYPAMKTAGV